MSERADDDETEKKIRDCSSSAKSWWKLEGVYDGDGVYA